MHLLGQLPWGLSRAIPVFLVVWLGASPIQSLIKAAPAWFNSGMAAVGHVLPTLGFALLLSMLPLRRFWPFLLIGFVLFAYLNIPIIGIAILAVAVGFLVNRVQQTRSAVNV